MSDTDKNARTPIIEQAAEWFVRLREGKLSESEYRRYLRWLSASPAHGAEASRVDRIDRLLRRTLLNQRSTS